MNRARWYEVKDVIAAALDRRGAERAALVRARCGRDTDLEHDALACLAQDDENDDDAWVALARRARESCELATPDASPRRVGRYRILRVLGSGGMGVVYEALQDAPARRVALKVLHLAQASDDAVLRFRGEAELLARLDHPAIARVFEAGTHVETFGGAVLAMPYIAMELVPGARDVVSDARARGLSRDACVLRAIELCDAVAFGHDRGIVHRDLKPSNVLVGDDGRLHVIDFGIARAFDAERATQTGEFLGTLRYMSPERLDARVGEAGPASDVYALGLMLHELVLGRLPFDDDAACFADIVIARRALPPAARRIDATISRDLECILAKALDPDPARRYLTARELAEDLRRSREHRPLLARPPRALDRLVRFARREPIVFGLGLALALVFVAGGSVSAWGWWRAALARADAVEAQGRAVASAADSIAVAGFLGDVFAAASPREGWRDATVREAMERAAPWIDERFATRPGVRFVLHRRFADTFLDLGFAAEAVAQGRKAEAALELDSRATDTDRTIVRCRIASALLDAGRTEEALQVADSVAGDWRAGTSTADMQQLFARDSVGQCLRLLGHVDESLALHRRVVADAMAAHCSAAELGVLSNSLAVALRKAGLNEEAIDLRRSLPALGGLECPPLDESRVDALTEWMNLAIAWMDLGDLVSSETILRIVIDRLHVIVGDDHPNARAAAAALAMTLSRGHREFEAEPIYRGSIDTAARAGDAWGVAAATVELARCLCSQDRRPEAEELLRASRASAIARGDDRSALLVSAALMQAIGEMGCFAEAAEIGSECVRVATRTLGATARVTGIHRYNEARMLASCGRRAEARERIDAMLAEPAFDAETRKRCEEARELLRK